MNPTLYSQTPGGQHMAGGYGIAPHYNASPYGTVFGPGSMGNSAANFVGAMPGAMLDIGSFAAMTGGFMGQGAFGSAVRGIGNTFGFGTLGMAASVPVTMMAQAGAAQFARGVDQQLYAQNAMSQLFGERNMGGRLGFGTTRDSAAGFARMFRELSSSAEMLTNDQELKSLFSKFNDMELLKLSKNATDAGARFKKLAETVRDISRDIGTTLEGVLPMFEREVQMGFTDPAEIRRRMAVNRAMRGVGVGVSDETNQGLQMSQSSANFGAGGSRKLGAQGAQQNLALVNVALQKGVLNEEDLMNATGQIGERGAADLTQQFMQATRTAMTSGSYGNLMSAYLGEVDDAGRFTGGMDKTRLKQLSTASFDDITKIANEKIQKGAVSFKARMEAGLGANLGAQMQGGEVARVFELLFKSMGDDSQDAMQLTLQHMTGMRGETARVLLRFMEQQGKMTDEVQRQIQSNVLRNRLPAELEHHYGLSSRLDQAYRRYIADPVFRPIQNVGGDVAVSVGNYFDNFGVQFAHHGTIKGGLLGLVGSGLGTYSGNVDARSRLMGARRGLLDNDRTGRANLLNSGLESAMEDDARGGRLITGSNLGAHHMQYSYAGTEAIKLASTSAQDAQRLMDNSVTDEQLSAVDLADVRRGAARRGFGPAGSKYKGGMDGLLMEVALDGGNLAALKRHGATVGGNMGMLAALIKYTRTAKDAPRVRLAQKLIQELKDDVAAQSDASLGKFSGKTRAELSSEMTSLIEGGGGGVKRSLIGMEWDQVENDVMSAALSAGDYERVGALNELFMTKENLEDLLMSDPADFISRFQERTGLLLNEGDFDMLRAQARQMTEFNYNDTGAAAAKYGKEVGRDIQDVSRRVIQLDARERRASFGAQLRPFSADVASAVASGSGAQLRDALRGKDTGDIRNVQARNLIDTFSEFSEMSIDEQRKFLIDKMGYEQSAVENMDQARLLDTGLNIAAAVTENSRVDSKELQAASAAGGSEKVAEIVNVLNNNVATSIDKTQRATLDFAVQIVDEVKKLKRATPGGHD